MADVPATTSTSANLSVGGSATNVLDFNGDHDWFAISLVGGVQVTVTVFGITLEDPLLTIRGTSGQALAANDDIKDGENRNSKVTFTPTTSGTYYIDVGAYKEAYHGTYQVSVNSGSQAPLGTVDAIAGYLVQGAWAGDAHHFAVSSAGTITVNVAGLNSAEQNLARTALQQWSDIIGVQFQEVTSGAQITFDNSEEKAGTPTAQADVTWSNGITSSAHVQISSSWLDSYGSSINSYGFQTYLHEIGHALGLGHAGDYNGTASYSADALFRNDAWPMTVMSYFDQSENSYFEGLGFDRLYALTPMQADIAAMQTLYGLSTTTRVGNSTYGFNSNAGEMFSASTYSNVALTIYDSGGTDTLDYSGSAANQLLNLTPQTFSNVNGRTGNLSIAGGVIVENAIGGSGQDTIIGNAAANSLVGHGGSDSLSGGDGNDVLSADREMGFDNFLEVDVLSGGAGNDFLFAGFGDIVDGGTGSDTLSLSYVGASAGINGDTAILHQGIPLVAGGGTLQGIERIADLALTQFDDRMVIGDQTDSAGVRGWDGNDHLIGQLAPLDMYGGNGDDILVGSTADDTIHGDAGNDTLMGHLGTDQLWGGTGNDRFMMTSLTAKAKIMDFEHGIDRIDVTGFDANTGVAGDQAFTFVGSANFSGKAGELRLAGSATAGYDIQGDSNGDGLADFIIGLGSAGNVTASDFLL